MRDNQVNPTAPAPETCENCKHHRYSERADLVYCDKGKNDDFCDKGNCEHFTFPF